MRVGRTVGWLAAVSIVLAGPSCGGDSGGGTAPPPPDPGPVHLVLSTPNPDDGGLLLAVSGGPVTSLGSAGFDYTGTATSTGARAIVRGDLTGGTVLVLNLPDRNRLDSYSVQLQQVSARAPSYRQRVLTGYQLTLVHP